MTHTTILKKPANDSAGKTLATPLTVTPLGATFVAEISGIDLSEPQPERTIESLHAALLKHKLLLFRGQSLTPKQQRDFARHFGPLHIHPLLDNVSAFPEIIVLDYDKDKRAEPDIWHTDVTFIQTPPLGSILHGVIIPEVGGDTLFSDLGAAYRALSAPLQKFLAGLTARHDFSKSFLYGNYGTPEGREKWNKTKETHPPVSHPAVRTHPETDEKGIFVNEGFTRDFEGLSQAESDLLLNFLFQHSTKPDFTYRHRWKQGDVLFWDNRITQHTVINDYWPRHRRMHRATILGDRPL